MWMDRPFTAWYVKLGADYYDQRNKPRVMSRLLRRLQNLGFEVTLQPSAPVLIDSPPALDPAVRLPECDGSSFHRLPFPHRSAEEGGTKSLVARVVWSVQDGLMVANL